MHLPTPRSDLRRADNLVGRPIAPLHEVVRLALEDARERRVLLEPGDERHRVERRDDYEAIFERIDWPVVTLSEPSHRCVRIERYHEASAERTRLREIRDVPTMQDVEDAVGEDE